MSDGSDGGTRNRYRIPNRYGTSTRDGTSPVHRRSPTRDRDSTAAPLVQATGFPPSFASASLAQHLLRGAVGFGGLIGAALLFPVLGWGGLALAPLGLLALRGCPLCWTMGLVQTVSMGRLRRSCADGRCELTTAAGSTRSVTVPSTAGSAPSVTAVGTPAVGAGPLPTPPGTWASDRD